MDFKDEDLKNFLRTHEHPTPPRPTGEWQKMEELFLRSGSLSKIPQGFRRFSTGISASLCVASFAAFFVWNSTKPMMKSTHSAAASIERKAHSPAETAVIDSEEVAMDAFFGDDEMLEDFEQAYVDVLE